MSWSEKDILNGVREYGEGYPVYLINEVFTEDRVKWQSEEIKSTLQLNEVRLVLYARNEGGNNCTGVDLLDVIKWVKENKPELLQHVSA